MFEHPASSLWIHLLPPGGGGTLHSPPWGLGLWRGGAGDSRGGAGGGGRALGLRDVDGELWRDDCLGGQSWFRLGEFLSLTVHADLQREDGEIQQRSGPCRDSATQSLYLRPQMH